MVGYIQADIWVRFQRLQGNTAHYVCADDAHGTPIMLAAERAGVAPEAIIASIQAQHERDFADFLVTFDHYHSTHSEENRLLSELIYTRLRAGSPVAAERENRTSVRWVESVYVRVHLGGRRTPKTKHKVNT